jgi:site-specific DNA-methyltransferase (adenine-specific)
MRRILVQRFSKNIVFESIGSGILITGNCINVMPEIDSNSVDVVITDPPYNYEFIGAKWDHKEIQRRLSNVKSKSNSTIVKNIPYGSGLAGGVRNASWYEKNYKNALDYQNWISSWAVELFRVCKPGAYVAVFNATRFLARVQIALEDAGFYPRDLIVMEKQGGIPKGLNAYAKLKLSKSPDAESWKGYHSALRNSWEGVVIVQKPLVNNYLNTLKIHGTGLMKAENSDGTFKTNILKKLGKREDWFEGSQELHATPKPLLWIEWLIELLCPPSKNSIVLDPFLGTGTTAIAAEKLGFKWIGIDVEPKYTKFAKKRINSLRKI